LRLWSPIAADRRPLARSLGLALAVGGAVARFLLPGAGRRADIGGARDVRPQGRDGPLGLVLAFGFCLDCAAGSPPSVAAPVALLALLAAAVAVELALVPAASWQTRLVGSNSMVCLPMVPILSLAPLGAAPHPAARCAARQPWRARRRGFSRFSGASLYAFHFDDSPLFVATGTPWRRCPW
jgi:hypothetical protein